ncbi:selenophosphate synthetase [Perkinsus olseni]|uniref:Selenophosphate synthetase n=2 Tax=Perkinsus olseni TaxID=32597 RepID=A0A7J6UJL8_PEROL|nr:selenophosphate synthetase [Perkinsus olseni]
MSSSTASETATSESTLPPRVWDPTSLGLSKDFVKADQLSSFLPAIGDGNMLTEDSPDCSVVPVGDGERVLVSSTDFLSPISQDPFNQGWIAAANTLSDLYAVGADDVNNILMILTVSMKMSPEEQTIVTKKMIEGFNACCEEAGTKVTGGQTVFNPWPLLGGCAMATVPQSQLVRTDLGVPGNVIVLTKPLGTQITGNLALWMMNQGQWSKIVDAGLDTETCTRAVKMGDLSMMTLNKNGCKYMREFGALGATDVTGFGLFGHADNLARVQKSGASIEIDTIPVIRGCKTLSTARPNGRDYGLFEGRASETSGGLLVMLKDEETATKFVKALRSCYGDDDPRREWGWIVGRVVETKNGDKQGASILPGRKVVEV